MAPALDRTVSHMRPVRSAGGTGLSLAVKHATLARAATGRVVGTRNRDVS